MVASIRKGLWCNKTVEFFLDDENYYKRGDSCDVVMMIKRSNLNTQNIIFYNCTYIFGFFQQGYKHKIINMYSYVRMISYMLFR